MVTVPASLAIVPLTHAGTLVARETTPVASSNFMGVINALTSQISVSTIVEVLTVGAGIAVGLAFMWWGVRKLTRILMAAFKKGRVSL